MANFLIHLVKWFAWRTGKFRGIYVRLCKPSGQEYANFLGKYGGFRHVGLGCSILPSTLFTDPAYVSIGDNVHFATCAIVGHDGSVGMMEEAYNVKIDAVGPVVFGNNIFVGHQAIIMPGVTIESDSIVAAGAVVTKDVLSDTIVAGVPAKEIGKVSNLLSRRVESSRNLPWIEILRKRDRCFDVDLEKELVAARVAHFF